MINYQKLGENDYYREVFSYSSIPHLHNEIEIIYVKDGSSILTVDNKQYTLKPNSLSIVSPNQVHKYTDNLESISGYMLHITTKEITNALSETPIICDLSLDDIEAFNKIQYLVESEVFDEAESLLNQLIIKNSNNVAIKQKSTSVLTTTQMILKYCFENYKEALTLDQLSSELSINKFYISHIFNSKLGIGFTDYISRLRIEEAKKLLCTTNISITNIAYDVGFSTIRSFNRRFREFCGIAPKDFKEKYNKQSTN